LFFLFPIIQIILLNPGSDKQKTPAVAGACKYVAITAVTQLPRKGDTMPPIVI